jgi:hypothetical protein
VYRERRNVNGIRASTRPIAFRSILFQQAQNFIKPRYGRLGEATPKRCGHCKVGGQRPSDGDLALAIFIEIALVERHRMEPLEKPAIDDRADGLHKVIGQRSAIGFVCMQDAEFGIEIGSMSRDGDFAGEYAIEVIQQAFPGDVVPRGL